MSQKSPDPQVEYSSTKTADFVGLSSKQVGRLAKAGHFPGARRKSPLAGSAWVIPGTAVIEFMKKRESS
jgi:hypothetical protein